MVSRGESVFNENINGLIRKNPPKEKEFASLKYKGIAMVQNSPDQGSVKVPGYKTFIKYFSKIITGMDNDVDLILLINRMGTDIRINPGAKAPRVRSPLRSPHRFGCARHAPHR